MRIDKGAWGNWITEAWPMEEVKVSESDKRILRELAKKLQMLSQSKKEEEKIKLWTAHNRLERTRPLILVDCENSWNEIFPLPDGVECHGVMAQDWELWLRKEIYWIEAIQDDKPVEAKFYLPYRAINPEWGINEDILGGEDKSKAYTWKTKLASLSPEEFQALDLGQVISKQQVLVDWETSNATFDLANEVFDGMLEVEFRTWWFWSPHNVLAYSHYRGMQNMMMDFYDFPDKVHEMMGLFTETYIDKLHQLEREGLLYDNTGNTFVGSGGLGHTSELHPVKGQVKLMDMWGLTEAQEAVGLSPDMFREYIFPYQKQVASLFGLNCYACCEPLDTIWDLVKTLPRLRRVSISQWSNMENMADCLKSDYIYSYKASSSAVAISNISEERIRKEIRNMLDHTRDNHVEIVLKDLHTLHYKPTNVTRWMKIAREEINRLYPVLV